MTDKKSFISQYSNSVLWIFVIIVTTLTISVIWYSKTHEVNPQICFKFWKYLYSFLYIAGTMASILLIIGGFCDLKAFFKDLKEEVVDETDDGFVRSESSSNNQKTQN